MQIALSVIALVLVVTTGVGVIGYLIDRTVRGERPEGGKR
jgi:hypothetical protein